MADAGLPDLRASPFILIAPPIVSRMPKSASESSFWPFPEIPAIPNISFFLTTRLRPFNARSFLSFRALRFSISRTGFPGRTFFFSSLSRRSLPTIRFASSLMFVSDVFLPATTRPPLRTTTRSAISITSFSLWDIKTTDRPSFTIDFNVLKSSTVSAGASTAVGSSIIRMSTSL